MPYFPDSLMTPNYKDESQDVRGNPYLIGAADHNKIEGELFEIEKFIGPRSPSFAAGFSGAGCGYPAFSHMGGYPVPPFQQNSILDQLLWVESVLTTVSEDVMTTSGQVAVLDPWVPGVDGLVPWPTSWTPYMTTLQANITDPTVNEEDPAPDLDSITVANVANMPEVGFVTLINPVWPTNMTIGSFNADFMAYGFSGTMPSNLARAASLGTNVEILQYWGIDAPTNRLLKVERKKQGSMCSAHSMGDLVFKGKLSLLVSPAMYMANNAGGFYQLECFCDPVGKLWLNLSQQNPDLSRSDNTTYAYAQYQATLVRSLLQETRT